MDTADRQIVARRGRWAVAAIFFVNGFLMGSWAPQIPVLLTRLDIGETTLGLLILGFGAGALCAMAWCGYLLARYGSRPVLRGFAASGIFGLLAVVVSPSVPAAAVALFLFGGLIGGMDVAMNASAVAVERRLGRAIMSSSHGFWSLGGFMGGAVGGVMIQVHGEVVHVLAVTALSCVVVLTALPYIVADQPAVQAKKPFSLPRSPSIYLIGVIALFCMTAEGAVLDWGALYLRQELGASIATAGFAFAGLSATMALMRFLGDQVRDRFGAVATLRASSFLAAAGMLGVGIAPLPWIAIAGFALSGVGLANIVPIAFSAAGNQSGLSAGAGLSTVTLMGYSGILVAPSAIGFVGERTGFAAVFIALAVLLAIVGLMAALARSAEIIQPHPAE